MIGRLARLLPPRLRGPARRFRQAARLRIRPWTHRGTARECPLCANRFRAFLADRLAGQEDSVCPACLSLPRHRALWALLRQRQMEGLLSFNGHILHVAPEPSLARPLRRTCNYLSMDIKPGVAMVTGDLTCMDFPDRSFDAVMCNHVLEHVRDDRAALKEIHRVLEPGGWASLLVPLHQGKTRESPPDSTPEYLLEHHGQRDHVRSYGDDFQQRLEAAEFRVDWVTAGDLLDADSLSRNAVEAGRPVFLAFKDGP